jgi:hypothetical protein
MFPFEKKLPMKKLGLLLRGVKFRQNSDFLFKLVKIEFFSHQILGKKNLKKTFLPDSILSSSK